MKAKSTERQVGPGHRHGSSALVTLRSSRLLRERLRHPHDGPRNLSLGAFATALEKVTATLKKILRYGASALV